MARAVFLVQNFSAALGAVETGVAWWIEQLADVAKAAIAASPILRRRITAQVRDGSIWVSEDKKEAELISLGPPHRGKLKSIVLDLAPEDLFVSEAFFPAGVKGDLRRAFSYQIDRITPFRSDEVVFDAHPSGLIAVAQKIKVSFALVRRGTLARYATALEAGGFRLVKARMTRGEGLAAFSFTLERQRIRSVSWLSNPVWSLAALVVAIASATAVSFVKDQQILSLDGEVAAVRDKASDAIQLASEVERLRNDVAVLARYRGRASASEIVGSLAASMPKDAWLENVTIEDGSVRVAGFAKGAVAVLKALEGAELFEKVAFGNQVSIDSGLGQERFDLKAGVVPGDRE